MRYNWSSFSQVYCVVDCGVSSWLLSSFQFFALTFMPGRVDILIHIQADKE